MAQHPPAPPPYEPQYVPALPHPALRGLVLRYTGYREHATAPLRRRQAPTGECVLILGFGPPLRLHGPAGPVVSGAFLAGMHDLPVVTEFRGAQEGVQVDLAPLGAHVLLGRPMSGLTDRCPPVDALGVPELASLPARLAEDAGWPARFARVDAVLLGLLGASRTRPDDEVAWAWRRLRATAGRATVGELAAGAGWSRRHLLTRFTGQVGLAPKTAGRVLRFRRASRLLVPTAGDGGRGPALPPPRIGDVAAACGYADHAHLVREFRALAGCTPTEYVTGWADGSPPIKTPGPDPDRIGP